MNTENSKTNELQALDNIILKILKILKRHCFS